MINVRPPSIRLMDREGRDEGDTLNWRKLSFVNFPKGDVIAAVLPAAEGRDSASPLATNIDSIQITNQRPADHAPPSTVHAVPA